MVFHTILSPEAEHVRALPDIVFWERFCVPTDGSPSLSGKDKTINPFVFPFRKDNDGTVEFQDMDFKKQTLEFTGFPAQIIQHEVDHLAGILI